MPSSPSPQIRVWGAGDAVSIPYGSFAEWLRDAARGTTGGVAIVRVVDVSPVRWSTASGAGPGPADLARVNRGEAWFEIGRLVNVELVRRLGGKGPAAGEALTYWLPGGQIGNVRTESLASLFNTTLPDPRPGALAVAQTWRGVDYDDTDGVLWVNVMRLFPVDDAGRVWTFRPDETIMIGDVERYLPVP